MRKNKFVHSLNLLNAITYIIDLGVVQKVILLPCKHTNDVTTF